MLRRCTRRLYCAPQNAAAAAAAATANSAKLNADAIKAAAASKVQEDTAAPSANTSIQESTDDKRKSVVDPKSQVDGDVQLFDENSFYVKKPYVENMSFFRAQPHDPNRSMATYASLGPVSPHDKKQNIPTADGKEIEKNPMHTYINTGNEDVYEIHTGMNPTMQIAADGTRRTGHDLEVPDVLNDPLNQTQRTLFRPHYLRQKPLSAREKLRRRNALRNVERTRIGALVQKKPKLTWKESAIKWATVDMQQVFYAYYTVCGTFCILLVAGWILSENKSFKSRLTEHQRRKIREAEIRDGLPVGYMDSQLRESGIEPPWALNEDQSTVTATDVNRVAWPVVHLYITEMREGKRNLKDLKLMWDQTKYYYPGDWLVPMEILQIMKYSTPMYMSHYVPDPDQLRKELLKQLMNVKYKKVEGMTGGQMVTQQVEEVITAAIYDLEEMNMSDLGHVPLVPVHTG